MLMSIDIRKQVGLEQKLGALDTEFARWLALSLENNPYEKHQTQIRALTGHLAGLWGKTKGMLDEATQDGTLLVEARNLESLVLGIRRIWEFFRSKLAQRWDPELKQFLQLSDELAWACYRPALEQSDSKRREPPLVFLNGGLSPFALSRDLAFVAEEVPGEPLSGKTYDPVLRHLPIPIIGVPWYQVAHLPDLLVVAHETGHAVEQDFGLHEGVVSSIRSALQGEDREYRFSCWQAWSTEIFADVWGCLTLGAAFVSSLLDFLATDRIVVENEIATKDGKYPTAHLRILLCLDVLHSMEFGETANELGNGGRISRRILCLTTAMMFTRWPRRF
jgi:hypothetical protein